MDNSLLIEKMNADSADKRLSALSEFVSGIGERTKKKGYTNNHVHSTYSFSPYSPTRIVYEAYNAGLNTVGIMDHDSIAGAKEFLEAGRIMNLATTIGFEMRTDWKDTPFADVRLNSPDQIGCAYMCVHGVPHQNIDKAEKFLSKIRIARNERNKDMVSRINEIVPDINLDFNKDVIPISYFNDGGSITERHILYALGNKIIEKTKSRDELIDYIENVLNIGLNTKQRGYLEDESNDTFSYDLLNVLKSTFVKRMFIEAEYPEILPVKEVIDFAHEIGAIPAYAYLGDVGDSVTGDKKAQKFEDSFLDELMEYNKEIGFDAIAYMPSRNSRDQLDRLIKLCRKHSFYQINGEDINQPRQSFICEELFEDIFIHLINNTWALIGHELKASEDISQGLFAGENKNKKLSELIDIYAKIGYEEFEGDIS